MRPLVVTKPIIIRFYLLLSAYPLLDYVISVIILQYVKCDKYKRKELFNTG